MGRANIFVTSRSIPDIVEEFKEATNLEIRAHEEDVHSYLDYRIELSDSPILKYGGSHLRKKIKTAIAKVFDGMYALPTQES